MAEYNCDDCNLNCAVVVESLCRNSLIDECKQLQAENEKLKEEIIQLKTQLLGGSENDSCVIEGMDKGKPLKEK